MQNLETIIPELFSLVIFVVFIGSLLFFFWFIYQLLSPPRIWNPETDKHIAEGGTSSGRGGHITTHLVPKDGQKQAKMYIPEEDK